jgi:hypothetical protein
MVQIVNVQIQSMYTCAVYLRYTLILFFSAGLQRLFCMHLICTARATCPARSIILDLIALIIIDEEYKLRTSLLCEVERIRGKRSLSFFKVSLHSFGMVKKNFGLYHDTLHQDGCTMGCSAV